MSRRDFITSVSALALASAVLPVLPPEMPGPQKEFVIVNGWVLHRNEVA